MEEEESQEDEDFEEESEDEDLDEELENIIDETTTFTPFRRTENPQHTLDTEPITDLEQGLRNVRIRRNDEQEENNLNPYTGIQNTYQETNNPYEENNNTEYETSPQNTGISAINRGAPGFQRDVDMRASATNYPGMNNQNQNYTPGFQQDSGPLPFEQKEKDFRLRDV